ncbi:MAG: bifunctional hydroxymethylpyrimidine kinase/phosphomethylpyrimidine kinase [Pseudomonadota bacterium]
MTNPTDIPIALTIAGSDPSGGAGIQADLKTFAAHHVYGAAVLTALTAQNTIGVQGVHGIPPAFVTQQIESVLGDLEVGAIKTGMLATTEIIAAVCDGLDTRGDIPAIVDPVMVATSGDPLLEETAEEAVRRTLLPRARLITPNIPEAARLLGAAQATSIDEMEAQARALLVLGPGAVLVKGGHGIGTNATDVLFDGVEMHRFSAPWVETKNTHGTGCTLSAAIAARLAAGASLIAAVDGAKRYVHAAISRAAQVTIGGGRGPLIHHDPSTMPHRAE